MCVYRVACTQLDPRCFGKLHKRLQHTNDLTLMMRPNTSLHIAPYNKHQVHDAQPAALRQLLRLLSGARWHLTTDQPPATAERSYGITLQKWTLTGALVRELSGLPKFEFPVTLEFDSCKWVSSEDTYQQLSSIVPACYTLWVVGKGGQRPCTPERLAAICRGAGVRDQGMGKLSVQCERRFLDEGRSLVHRCIDEGGLQQCVDVEWD